MSSLKGIIIRIPFDKSKVFLDDLNNDDNNDFMGLTDKNVKKIVNWVVDHASSTSYAAE